MRIEVLEEFVTLAKVLNFSVAAQLFFISQPTLSKHIRDLEAELGTRLFERDSHSVTLTTGGGMLLADAQLIVDAYRRIRSSTQKGQEGPLRIGTPLRFQLFSELASRSIELMHASHPDIACEVYDTGIDSGGPELLKLECDILLTYQAPQYDIGDLECCPLFSRQARIWVSSDSDVAAKGFVTPQELNHMVFRPSTSDRSSPWIRLVVESLQECGVEPVIGAPVDDRYHLEPSDYGIVFGGSPNWTFGSRIRDVPLLEGFSITAAAVFRRHSRTSRIDTYINYLKLASSALQ